MVIDPKANQTIKVTGQDFEEKGSIKSLRLRSEAQTNSGIIRLPWRFENSIFTVAFDIKNIRVITRFRFARENLFTQRGNLGERTNQSDPRRCIGPVG